MHTQSLRHKGLTKSGTKFGSSCAWIPPEKEFGSQGGSSWTTWLQGRVSLVVLSEPDLSAVNTPVFLPIKSCSTIATFIIKLGKIAVFYQYCCCPLMRELHHCSCNSMSRGSVKLSWSMSFRRWTDSICTHTTQIKLSPLLYNILSFLKQHLIAAWFQWSSWVSKGDDPKPGAEQGYTVQLCSSVPPNHSYFENWGELQMLRPMKGAALHNLFLLCRSMGTNGCEKNWVEDLGSLERAQRKNREAYMETS